MINIPAPLLEALLSVLRAVLNLGAGYLVGKGYLSADLATALVGAVLIAAPMVWGAWQKFEADKKTRALVAAAITDPREIWTDEQRAAFALIKSTTGAG